MMMPKPPFFIFSRNLGVSIYEDLESLQCGYEPHKLMDCQIFDSKGNRLFFQVKKETEKFLFIFSTKVEYAEFSHMDTAVDLFTKRLNKVHFKHFKSQNLPLKKMMADLINLLGMH